MSRTCPRCGDALERRPVPGRSETAGAVSVMVRGISRWSCPQGHRPELAKSGLLELLLEAADEQLVSAPRTRVRRRLRCGVCEAELTVPGRRTTRSVSTVVDEVGVVTATFDLPVLRCPACGVEQVPGEVAGDDVRAALAAAVG